VVETLKVVTEQEITTTTTTTIEEKYKVLAPESMQETFMSDSEDEGGKLKHGFLPIFNNFSLVYVY
jgi:ankyrin